MLGTPATALIPLALQLALASPVPATASPVDPPAEAPRLEIIVTNGSGCPSGSVEGNVAPDSSAVVINYHDYLARIGPGARATDARRNCQIGLRLTPPAGYSYGITRVDHSGSLHLERGVIARVPLLLYTSGLTPTSNPTTSLVGPLDGAWTWTYPVPPIDVIHSACGEARWININTELRLTAGASDKTVTSTISLTPPAPPPAGPPATTPSTPAPPPGPASSTYHLTWVTCPAR